MQSARDSKGRCWPPPSSGSAGEPAAPLLLLLWLWLLLWLVPPLCDRLECDEDGGPDTLTLTLGEAEWRSKGTEPEAEAAPGAWGGSEAERDGKEIKFPKQKRVMRSQHT